MLPHWECIGITHQKERTCRLGRVAAKFLHARHMQTSDLKALKSSDSFVVRSRDERSDDRVDEGKASCLQRDFMLHPCELLMLFMSVAACLVNTSSARLSIQ